MNLPLSARTQRTASPAFQAPAGARMHQDPMLLERMAYTRCKASGIRALLAIALCSLLMMSCVSADPIQWGIQPEYQALNPSRILAATPIVLAMPGDKQSNIDPTIVQTVPVAPLLEKHVLSAFTGQPGVNGMSFEAVRAQLEKEKSTAFDRLVEALNGTVSLLRNSRKEQEGRLGTSCIRRRNFLEFYQFCLRDQPKWRNGLNQMARDVLNADAALLLFMTQMEKQTSKGLAATTVTALLVDTNNARMIWAGSMQAALKDDASQKPSVLWDTLLAQAAGEQLWESFPGRLPKAPEADAQNGSEAATPPAEGSVETRTDP
jgi:hypothetical protein